MIVDVKDTNNIGILFINDKNLQEITAKSGALAINNEYQVHYWALVVRNIFADGSVIDFAIPTVYFNYKQEVSGAHIDFHTIDVDTISELVKPAHDKLTQLLASTPNLLTPLKIAPTVQLLSAGMNSIHRHPGGASQSFSGTDYSTNKADTGIVFPLKSAHERPNFASIIAHVKGKTVLAHTEYRIAFGDIDTELKYFQGRCATFVKGSVIHPSQAMKFLGLSEIKDTSYTISKYIPDDTMEILETKLSNFNFEDAITDFIDATNVTKREVIVPTYNGHSFRWDDKENTKSTNKLADYLDVYGRVNYKSKIVQEVREFLDKTMNFETFSPTAIRAMDHASLLKYQERLIQMYFVNPELATRESEIKDLIENCIELTSNVIEEAIDERETLAAAYKEEAKTIAESTATLF